MMSQRRQSLLDEVQEQVFDCGRAAGTGDIAVLVLDAEKDAEARELADRLQPGWRKTLKVLNKLPVFNCPMSEALTLPQLRQPHVEKIHATRAAGKLPIIVVGDGGASVSEMIRQVY